MAKKIVKTEETVSVKAAVEEAVKLHNSIDQLYRATPKNELYSALVTTELLIKTLKGLK